MGASQGGPFMATLVRGALVRPVMAVAAKPATESGAPKMTEAELRALFARLEAEYYRQLDFIRTAGFLLGLLPLIYGILTWVFGDALWTGSQLYRTALEVPGAPQSWGTVFIVMGALTCLSSFWFRPKLTASATLGSALVLASFMFSFGWSAYQHESLSALPPTVVYGILSLLFFALARLAWKSRGTGR